MIDSEDNEEACQAVIFEIKCCDGLSVSFEKAYASIVLGFAGILLVEADQIIAPSTVIRDFA